MKRLKLLTLSTVATLFLSFGFVVSVGAVDVFQQCGGQGGSQNASQKIICNDVQGGKEADSFIKNVINTILYLLGIIAVIAIIIGGFRYVTSNGDPGAVKSAKDTILYAVIGLVDAMLAWAIVNFVVKEIG